MPKVDKGDDLKVKLIQFSRKLPDIIFWALQIIELCYFITLITYQQGNLFSSWIKKIMRSNNNYNIQEKWHNKYHHISFFSWSSSPFQLLRTRWIWLSSITYQECTFWFGKINPLGNSFCTWNIIKLLDLSHIRTFFCSVWPDFYRTPVETIDRGVHILPNHNMKVRIAG